VDWIYVAQNGENWRVVVKTVMNIRVSKTRVIPRLLEELSAA
jgi:hypothetical protein